MPKRQATNIFIYGTCIYTYMRIWDIYGSQNEHLLYMRLQYPRDKPQTSSYMGHIYIYMKIWDIMVATNIFFMYMRPQCPRDKPRTSQTGVRV